MINLKINSKADRCSAPLSSVAKTAILTLGVRGFSRTFVSKPNTNNNLTNGVQKLQDMAVAICKRKARMKLMVVPYNTIEIMLY